jgi:hypothetical protein
MNNSWVWIRFGTGQPFKVSIADCQDVADLIEATRNKLGLSERLDELYLFVIDTDGFKGKQQRPGKLITQVLKENYPAGRNDQHPLLIRKVNQSQWQPDFPENQICSTFRMEFYQLVYSCICRFELLGFGVIQFLFGNFPVYHAQNCSLCCIE